MNILFALFTFLCIQPSSDLNLTILNSTIDEVTVFQNSARVIRRTEPTRVGNDLYYFSIEGISPFLDKNSVQIKLAGQGIISKVKYRKNYLLREKISDEIQELKDLQERKNDSIAEINLVIKTLKEHENFLKSNIQIKGANQSLTLQNFSNISSFYRKEIKEVMFAIKKNHDLLDKLRKENQNFLLQINELKPKIHSIPYDALITVSSYASQNVSLELTYQVKNAGWHSSYHLRAKM